MTGTMCRSARAAASGRAPPAGSPGTWQMSGMRERTAGLAHMRVMFLHSGLSSGHSRSARGEACGERTVRGRVEHHACALQSSATSEPASLPCPCVLTEAEVGQDQGGVSAVAHVLALAGAAAGEGTAVGQRAAGARRQCGGEPGSSACMCPASRRMGVAIATPGWPRRRLRIPGARLKAGGGVANRVNVALHLPRPAWNRPVMCGHVG